MLYHRLIPERWNGAVSSNWYDAVMREKLVPAGAEFISAWEALCNTDGCLTRAGPSAGDISVSDQVHLTDKGSVYLIRAVIDACWAGRQLHPSDIKIVKTFEGRGPVSTEPAPFVARLGGRF